MWSIKETKATAGQILKKNYWILVFICSVMLFLGILPGNGMKFASMSATAITGEKTESAEEYKPGLVRYLDSIVNGESKERQLAIAQEVMESSKGRGGAVYGLVRAVDRFFFANDTAAKALIVISLIVYLIFWFCVGNLLLVGFSRISIDAGRPDHKVHFSDLFCIYRSNGYLNTTGVSILWELCLDALLLIAWGLGIWGATAIVNNGLTAPGVIIVLADVGSWILFFYVYLMIGMVPYILATNPRAKFKECLVLSKEMTYGSKWQIAKLRLSYIGWDILSVATLGLVNLFYITPALYMAYGQVYLKLREKALRENLSYSYLIEGESPEFCPEALQPNKFGQMIEDRQPIRKYSLINIVLMFFIFAFIGWCWEVLLHIIEDGLFINRGTMHGPWLPIYGFGGAGICYFLNRFAKKPALLVGSIFVGCGVLEYFGHWFLEVTKHTKWWDYSNYFLNINGRVCFEGLFVFCVAGVFAVYVAGPALDNLLNRVPDKKKWTAAGILLAIFAVDGIYSQIHPNVGKGITDYDKK